MAKDEAMSAALALCRILKRTAAKNAGRYSEDLPRWGETGDATYEVDVPVEAAVAEYFEDLDLPCTVMTEDAGIRVFGKDPRLTFLIDPLDGSRNARRGLPFYCASVAVYGPEATEVSEASCAAIVRFDEREEFLARRGGGATRNGMRIRPSEKAAFDDATIALGCHFTKSIPLYSEAARRLGSLTREDARGITIRCYGSTALEMAYLASGKLDMLYDMRAATGFKASPKTYDVAAGILLCAEAGAPLTYGSRKMPERLPIDPHVPVQVLGAGNAALFKALGNTLR
jgi:myo-inositol-1(or 4)-monophosphatase